MAKSTRFEEIEDIRQAKDSRARGNFWEHWFQAQSRKPSSRRNLDEHSIWEKAIHFSFLTAGNAKF